MRTLRGRLLIGTALGTGLVLSASALVLYMIVRAALWAEFDEALGSKARSLATLVEQERNEIDLEFGEHSLPEFKPSERAEYYQVWASGGHVLARSSSLGDRDLDQLHGRLDEPAYKTTPLPDGRPGRSVGITFAPRQEKDNASWQTPHEPIEVTLVIGRGTFETDQALGRLRLLLVCGCAGAILVSVVVLSWLVRRGLKPLGYVAAEIAAIGEADLSSRLEPGDAPGELAPIITRLNDLLARLESAFAREKAITADVSHELRTPLAGLRSTLEVSLSKERAATSYREAIAKSLAICRQMQQMVENLLELARADAGQLEVASDAVDLVALLKDCWMPFAHRAAERRLEVTWQLPESCPVTTDHTKVCLILSNIFDNATTYVDTGGQVTIALHSEHSRSNLRVANTGSRVAELDASRVFDRFWRGDAARTAKGNSRRYGLGLPLCQKLVTLLGGSISVLTTSGGTFVVSVALPV
ncbi:MAG: sensor histidine kinase N-terminal domain-containing protein [Phycisphaerae bacterium]|nr:sensor histidine kinase N-terminal domain-containing protein [Phycisphaerae bacterium]